MNLTEVTYPVYRLKNSKPLEHKGIYFYAYDNYVEDDEGALISNKVVRIIDDTNIQASSLALRRLVIKTQGAALLKLNVAIFFLGDLIKLAKANTWFIDSQGKIFEVNKTTRCKLKFHKIAKVIPLTAGGAIIEVVGIPTRFKLLHYPKPTEMYAGILYNGKSMILYGVYDVLHKDTWRMI